MSTGVPRAVKSLPMPEPFDGDPQRIAQEAARYAVLRRVAAAMRHEMAGALQPVSMLASLIDRRVQNQKSAEVLQRNCAELGAMVRSASATCLGMMAWIAPPSEAVVALGKGVADCVQLLATELSFLGCELVDTCQHVETQVSQHALRSVLPASLLVWADHLSAASQLVISAEATGPQVLLKVTVRSSGRSTLTPAGGHARSYRPLSWDDVSALAQAESIPIQIGSHGLQLQFGSI
jgi:hypothetical protein